MFNFINSILFSKLILIIFLIVLFNSNSFIYLIQFLSVVNFKTADYTYKTLNIISFVFPNNKEYNYDNKEKGKIKYLEEKSTLKAAIFFM